MGGFRWDLNQNVRDNLAKGPEREMGELGEPKRVNLGDMGELILLHFYYRTLTELLPFCEPHQSYSYDLFYFCHFCPR